MRTRKEYKNVFKERFNLEFDDENPDHRIGMAEISLVGVRSFQQAVQDLMDECNEAVDLLELEIKDAKNSTN